MDQANRFLRRSYIREFNRKFTVEAAEPNESAFLPCIGHDLDRVFSIQTERVVGRDNTVRYKNLILQIDKQSWRRSMEGCRVIVYQHFDGTITIGYGPQQIGKYNRDGKALKPSLKTNGLVKSKPVPASISQTQTGHLMC